MKKLIIALVLLASFCQAGQLTYTTAEIDQFLTRVDNLGWAVYFDDQFTEGSPYVVNNTRTNIIINGLGSATVTDYLPDSVASLWDTNTNEIVSSKIGNSYDVRLQFKAKAAVGATFFDIEFDIGDGAGPIIAARTMGAPKANGVEIQYSIGIPLFSMATFTNNGCGIWINTTVDATNLSIYDVQVYISQDFYE